MKEMLVSVCAAALLTAVYKALVPAERSGAQIKLLTACFFVVTAVNAFMGAAGLAELPELTASAGTYNDYTVRVTETVKSETAGALRRAIEERLSEEGIYPEKIYIDVHIADNDRISINEIRLVFAGDDGAPYSERAVAAVRGLVGASVRVSAQTDPRTASRGGSQ
ncbi:MAG: hypothetical protein K5876_00125 [Ruminiclostridium sp.]|nr:hypothetical protein [Ruminiclostridium sp.]